MQNYALSRRNLVDGQLRPNAVTDLRLLEAIASAPREAFLPESLQPMAYSDEELPLPEGRFVLAPLVLARMIQVARPQADDKVLVVGGGVGYGAGLLGKLAQSVVALDCSPALSQIATSALAVCGAGNVSVVSGPLEAGWAPAAPYDVILVEGAVEEVPQALETQLAEGGRLVLVVSSGNRRGTVRLYLKTSGNVSGRPLFDAASSVLPGLQRRGEFRFAT